MHVVITILSIALVVTLVAGLCERWGFPAPLALLLVGVLGSALPWVPEIELGPELVLTGMLPPLLFAAAIRVPLIDFRRNIPAILSLSVGLVLATAAAVGLVVWLLLPVPFWVAFALGAIVGPPDAVAATAVANRIGLPRRLVTILEGESLLNDATALVSLRTAVAAAGLAAAHAEEVTAWSVGTDFLWAVGAGVAIGLAAAYLVRWLRRFSAEPVVDTALSLMTPFIAFVPAEEVHASGVIAVVTAGLLLGHWAPVHQAAASRISQRTNWATISFLLENAVFLLMGLQLVYVVEATEQSGVSGGRIALATAATLAVVLLVRPLWLVLFRGILLAKGASAQKPWSHTWVLGWAGMRGVVTLAAALSLPAQTPLRSVLILIALFVAILTLLLQGLTLPTVARRLGVRGPDPLEDALQEAMITQQTTGAALAALEAAPGADSAIADSLRQQAELRANITWERLGRRGAEDPEPPREVYRRLRAQMLDAQREELLRIRDAGEADQHVLAGVLSGLDVEEAILERVEARNEVVREAQLLPPEAQQGGCEHLRDAPGCTLPDAHEGCPDCLREGTDPVHLRMCLTCGHVACCDSSVGQHATRHFQQTGHPVMRSFEPGEAWRWCYVDGLTG
ncbi:MAG: Na+/H+ antiporter [Micrococcales bacterium]|nr:Na+/H+ antiporter [Micrococcales bacterium]